jgi:hypothetical protein
MFGRARVSETEFDVRDVEDIAVLEGVRGRALAIHKGAVRALEVADDVLAVGDFDRDVFLGHLAGIHGVVGASERPIVNGSFHRGMRSAGPPASGNRSR